MANDTSLVEIINRTIDQNDPTQKAIGLLAVLVDSKINAMTDTISKFKGELEGHQMDLNGLKHLKECPLKLETKFDKNYSENKEELEKINAILQPLYFVDKYPKLAMLMVIGILALCGLGLERVISFF